MNHYYAEYNRFLIAIDCIIFGFDDDNLKLLLIKRNFEPEHGKWSLMGGFLNKKETLDIAASRILETLTGLKNVYLEQLGTYSNVTRDPGERVLSAAYYSLIRIDDHDSKLLEEHNAKWIEIDKVPSLIFDHNEMVDKALKRLKRRCKSQPVGFELLPEKFTIPQLQKLYEAVFQKELDRRNFRNKILAMDFIDRLDEKDKSSSRKGAFLYKFNYEKYNELLNKGIHFEI